MKPIRVLLVDDQALFREGLHTLLSVQPGVEVVGEAAHGEEAVQRVKELQPHVVLMDLRMPVLGGVEATRRILAASPQCHVIVLTTFDDDEEVFDALRAGAVGYLLKDASSEKLLEAIRAAARSESFLQPSIAAKVVAEFSRLSQARPRSRAALVEPLSAREVEVLRHLARGKSNKEIGVALDLAEGTVKNHMTNILGKLGVLDRTQAALMAREMGLI
ncbi:MAG: response regulator transcription factor [Verrucomicrobia bacterium]|nr:response regulator transcription factor [Verrucomicrobiota bacterium]